MNDKSQDVLITGASGAIGEAFARRFARLGYTVHLTSREPKRLKALTKELTQGGSHVITYRLELANIGACQRVVTQFFKNAKNPAVLICNAGNLGQVEPFQASDFNVWAQRIMENFLGQAAMIHAFVRLFKKRKFSQGTILTLSGAGLGANTSFDRLSSYSTAKAALTHLVEALAPELMNLGITINAMAPGQVVSGITRQALKAGKKAGAYAQSAQQCLASGGVSPELVCDLAEFLVSPAARTLSGRLLSARFDGPLLKSTAETVAKDPNLFRQRRIDNFLFKVGQP